MDRAHDLISMKGVDKMTRLMSDIKPCRYEYHWVQSNRSYIDSSLGIVVTPVEAYELFSYQFLIQAPRSYQSQRLCKPEHPSYSTGHTGRKRKQHAMTTGSSAVEISSAENPFPRAVWQSHHNSSMIVFTMPVKTLIRVLPLPKYMSGAGERIANIP